MWHLVDCLVHLFFRAKNFKFSPLPDNCPPDGSMQFVSSPPPAHELLPPGFLYYEFGPNCDESNPDAIELSKQIIGVLCQSRKVLTVIQAHKQFDGNGKEIQSLFIGQYGGVLRSAHPEISVYQEGETKLAYLTTGYDKDLLPTYYALNGGLCDFSFYLFHQNEPLTDASQALSKATAHQYAFKLEYIDHGPVALAVYVNKNAGDIELIRNVIERVCSQNNILLKNPPMT